MTKPWERRYHPCGNLLCRINIKGYCDAGDMLELLCSSEDIYKDCKERIYGESLIENIKKLLRINIIKDKKNNLIEKEIIKNKIIKNK